LSAFGGSSCVGRVENLLVNGLVVLANTSSHQLYCGRSADGRSVEIVSSEPLPSVTRMANPGLGQNADLAEAIFNLANNGVLSRIDERGKRCHDLFQWGIHPHHSDEQSSCQRTTQAH
jgi:hypothetical protein